MFWGSFLYNRKGPCYIWKPKTAKEKEALQLELKMINKAIELELWEAWELTTGLRRLGLYNKLGRKLSFYINKGNRAFKRNSKKGGIN